jgi:hypothetical protein
LSTSGRLLSARRRNPHGERERGGFESIESTKINGHQHCSHLVIGNFPGGEFADEFLNLFRRENFSFALGFDDGKKIHAKNG